MGITESATLSIYKDEQGGQIETMKYRVLDSMLLTEVQRQEKVIGEQKSQIHGLEDRWLDWKPLLAPDHDDRRTWTVGARNWLRVLAG